MAKSLSFPAPFEGEGDEGCLRTTSASIRAGTAQQRVQEFEETAIGNLRPYREVSVDDMIRAHDSSVRNMVKSIGVNGVREDKGCCILHPHSRGRIVLDVLGCVALMYDAWSLPRQVAWNVAMEGPVLLMAWITFLFWTFDTVMGFFSGYLEKGRPVLQRRAIVNHYLRSLFFPYLLALAADAVTLVYAAASEEATQVRVMKSLRLLRLPRILRAFTVSRRASKLIDAFIQTWRCGGEAKVALTCAKLVGITMWVCHLAACFFRGALGTSAIDYYYESYGFEANVDANDQFSYWQYFYWAVNVLIAANAFTLPRTLGEIIVTIICLFIGLLWSSLVIGFIGDTLMHFRMDNQNRHEQINALRLYMSQASIETMVASDVERHALRTFQRARLVEEDVELLNNISPSMREALRILVFKPALRSQVFVRACEAHSDTFLRDVCSHAFGREVTRPGDVVFKRGDEALGAKLAYWGDFEYVKPDVVDAVADGTESSYRIWMEKRPSTDYVKTTSKNVDLCRWICELALLCEWQNLGDMSSRSIGEVLTINGKGFSFILQQDMFLSALASDYAGGLCLAVKRQPKEHVSDLQLPVAHEKVVTLMPSETRFAMSKAALDMAHRRSLLAAAGGVLSGVSSAAAEARRHQCDMVVRSTLRAWNVPLEECVLKVVPVVSLRLEHEDGGKKVLVQLGRLSIYGLDLDVGLPTVGLGAASGSEAGVLAEQALQQLLDGPLENMKDAIAVLPGKEVEVEPLPTTKSSRILERKLRHTFFATVSQDWLVEGERHGMVRFRSWAPTVRSKTSRFSSSRPAEGDRRIAAEIVEAAFIIDDIKRSPVVFTWIREDLVVAGDVRQPELVRAVEAVLRQKGELPRLRRPRSAGASGAVSRESLSPPPTSGSRSACTLDEGTPESQIPAELSQDSLVWPPPLWRPAVQL